MSDAAVQLQRALEAHQAGELGLAEGLYRQVIAAYPDHAEALFYLALLCLQTQRFEEARRAIERAAAAAPGNVHVQSLRGQVLQAQGELAAAEAAYRAALAIAPGLLEARGNLALLLETLGRPQEAMEHYRAILRVAPDMVPALINLGALLLAQGEFDAARSHLARAVGLAPDSAPARYNLGRLLIETGEEALALTELEHCVALAPDHADSRLALAEALARNGRVGEAAHALEAALRLAPDDEPTRRRIAELYLMLGRSADAVRCYLDCIDRTPGEAANWCGLGAALIAARDDLGGDALGAAAAWLQRTGAALELAVSGDERALQLALACCDRAIALAPALAQAYLHRAIASRLLGDEPATESALRTAVACDPHLSAAHNALAALLLGRARYREGWVEYAWRNAGLKGSSDRRDGKPYPAVLTQLQAGAWQAIQGKNVLVEYDQGIGDEIFFLRFLPVLQARSAHVTYKPSAKLRALLAHGSPLRGTLANAADGSERRYDRAVLVSDLPLVLGHDEHMALPAPLALQPSRERVASLRAKLGDPAGRLVVGVTWRAGPAPRPGAPAGLVKNIDAGVLGQALAGVPAIYVILQRGPDPREIESFSNAVGRAVADFSACNEDLEDMLAVLSSLDEYVGVSNTNMHLRAGLGLGARVLVAWPPDWRWMAEGETSPWFPGFKLYREDRDKGWAPALAQLAYDLSTTADKEIS